MIRLGPNSPLLTPAGARRRLAPSEADEQKALVALLVGQLGKGEQRALGKGMTGRHPELLLLYAINPNKGGQRSVAARGMAKAMGLLPDMMDLCLPVARGPFHSLYLELKRIGEYGSAAQRAMAEALRAEGHCVIECQGVEEGAQAILGYLALPDSLTGRTRFELPFERERLHKLLTPKRR